MKSIVTIAIVLLGFGSLQAQDVKKEEFKVYGNCGMCEARIEKAAKGVDGVSSADWDQETKMIEVTYDPGELEMMDIHKAIAKVGHDTEKVEAEDKVYEGLPGCCKYERKAHHDMDDDEDGHHH
ncbi:MAG: heavy-metal-associated domain-containing protein [Bacteroidota bacterium]|nr:heavy-metal-associated domain-containing protein [Bacteroidota bacterium]